VFQPPFDSPPTPWANVAVVPPTSEAVPLPTAGVVTPPLNVHWVMTDEALAKRGALLVNEKTSEEITMTPLMKRRNICLSNRCMTKDLVNRVNPKSAV
jgi:hypothetical protein